MTLNGQPWPCDVEQEDLKIAVSLDAGQSVAVGVQSVYSTPPAAAWKSSGVHNLNVIVRRRMCEFRDNYLDTSPVLSGVVSGVRRLGSTAAAAATTVHFHSLKAAARQRR